MKEKKKHSESLKYLGAVGSVLAAYNGHAQIKYVDVLDTTLSTNNATWNLNIDDDSLGVIDYRFIQYVDTSIFNVSGSFIQAQSNAGNSVLGIDYANYAYPTNLSPGDSIGASEVFRGSGGSAALGQLALEISDTGHVNDKFRGAINGLIGLRFRADVDDTIRIFYGWVRVDVAADYKSLTVKDFAYKEQYGEGLTAGEGSPWIGLEETEVNTFKLRQLEDQLFFELPKSAKLEIFSIGGTLIKAADFNDGTHRVDLTVLDKGIYIARISDDSYSEEIRVLRY
jgi:hypothetical protein